jgi:uncharacterized protein (DUF2141 family)
MATWIPAELEDRMNLKLAPVQRGIGNGQRWATISPVLCSLSILLGLLSTSFSQTPTPSELIHVEVSGMRNDKGQIVCALFSSAADFPKNGDKAVAQSKGLISHGNSACEFPDVPPGRYAVSVFHDENSNGKMDTNFMGIPREGVGASNNARGHLGPPKFDDAAFRYSGGKLDLTITIAYL